MSRAAGFLSILVLCPSLMVPVAAPAEELPAYLKDRGTGMPTSMFGTYITKHQLLIYPFYEYYLDDDLEYKPTELGYPLDEDFRGKYRANEFLLYFGYGISDWLMVEFEAALYIDASLETSPDDSSGAPARTEESGTGDVEGQLRARLMRETESRPELFAYFEAVSPQQEDKVLIGTADWELKLGVGVIRGFSFGTMTLRIAGEYSLEEDKADLGEYALEYLKRLSPKWRIYLGVEGSQDELSFIPEAQWHIRTDRIIVKLNSGFGVTSKATDWAPEVGVVFALGGK
ncbi:MAG: hypothetical protein OEX18_01020 [Candidatus Krumholzibacteria bacterium]|nr:hypothetical protein [Candidatus Krumholzibacteria bacterium]MDH4335846.1 hypothetical protein [Candidatus Krumholzibacteria bacterium]MDH5269372.1 hypothetical protein [Candidatus Krumholzibacteria bacterium]MDH5627656.1 hypothetical protein [Candidatus Krumholzibacteria bacterium]